LNTETRKDGDVWFKIIVVPTGGLTGTPAEEDEDATLSL
jgi:hypothetical protein